MVFLLLLPLLWGGSLQELPGYELRVQKSVSVQEGLCIYVPCSFSYPGSSLDSSMKLNTYWYQIYDYWRTSPPVASSNPGNPVKRETQGRFLLADPKNSNCSLNIRDARKSDTGTYVFRVETGSVAYTYRDKKLTVQVIALTEIPHIYFLEPLLSGHPTHLTCSLPGSCDGGRPFTFSWAGASIDSLNPQELRSSVVTFTPKPQDHGTEVTCQVKLRGTKETTQRTIRLNVFYAPRNLAIHMAFRNDTGVKSLKNTSSLLSLEGEALTLFCEADSNPPAVLSWTWKGQTLNPSWPSQPGVLELPHVQMEHEGEFVCQARNSQGSLQASLSLTVHYPPQLLGPSCSWEDKCLHCSCSSKAQPAPSLRWRLGEGLLERNHSNASYRVTSSSGGPWVNSSLSLWAELSTGLRLCCEAQNAHGAQSATVLLLPGKSDSMFGVIPAALGGAGAMGLLLICFCLIFFWIVKVLRKQAAGRSKATGHEDLVMGTVTGGSKEKPGPDGCPDLVSAMGTTSLPSQEQDTEYANVSFHERKSGEPTLKEASRTCEYSEIKKTRK